MDIFEDKYFYVPEAHLMHFTYRCLFYFVQQGAGVSSTKKIHFVPLPPPPLVGANPLQRPLEGVGPENQDFWTLKWQPAKLMYVKLPIYLFFYMTLGLDDFYHFM
jgi:hypothetical protein